MTHSGVTDIFTKQECFLSDGFQGLTEPTKPTAPCTLLSSYGIIYVTWYTSGLPEATGVRLRLPNSHALLGVEKHSLGVFLTVKLDRCLDIVRKRLTSTPAMVHAPVPRICSSTLSTLETVTVDEVTRVIRLLPQKTSPLDIMPVSLLKLSADTIAPLIARLANLSFANGAFPSRYKVGQVIPLLKKSGLPAHDPANYRPIRNLCRPTFSKILEKLFLLRQRPHVMNSENYCKFQSAYRKGYCTETALLRVTNDIQTAAGQGLCTALLSLDISAAFDAVHHDTLLVRARTVFGIDDVALDWIRSFVTGRTQQIVVGLEKSTVFSSKSGVPQGSVLGPILFGMYVSPCSRRRHCTALCTLPSVRGRHAIICVTKATRLHHDSQLGAVRHWRLAVVHWKCATAQSYKDRGSNLWDKPAAKTSSQYTRRLNRRSPRQVLRRCQAPWSDTRLSTDVRQTHHKRYSLLLLSHACTAPYSSATVDIHSDRSKKVRKIIKKIVATRCHILSLKYTKFDFGCDSAPDPVGGDCSAPPDLQDGFKGAYFKGRREGMGEERGEWKRKEGEKGRDGWGTGEGRDWTPFIENFWLRHWFLSHTAKCGTAKNRVWCERTVIHHHHHHHHHYHHHHHI